MENKLEGRILQPIPEDTRHDYNIVMVKEQRLVIQDWYETEFTKTGWDNHGWQFKDSGDYIQEGDGWEIVQIFDHNKFGNPILGLAQKETNIY